MVPGAMKPAEFVRRYGRWPYKCTFFGDHGTAVSVVRPRGNRIKRLELDPEFNEIKRLSEGDSNNCTVVAAAVVTGKPFAEVNAKFATAGRQKGRGFHLYKTLDIIRNLGFTLVPVNRADMIARYPGRAKKLRNITTHHPDRFPGVWRDGRTYFLNCRSHVVAVKNGRCVDWTRSRAMRVHSLWEVVPNSGVTKS